MRLLIRMVGTTHHRADSRMLKAHRIGFFFKHLESVRMHVATHGYVAGAGRQILTDGQHVDLVVAHVLHHRQNFLVGFAEANHQPAFGWHIGEELFELFEQIQAERIVAAGPRFFVETRHGFHVVVHHIGRRGFQNFQCAVIPPAEVGHQDFDLRLG